MSKKDELIISEAQEKFEVTDPKQLEIIKKTIAKNANDEEFSLFIQMCKATGLNPFLREIWLIITSPDQPQYRQCQMMTGINGFYTIANTNPSYDGEVLKYGPEIKIKANKDITVTTHEWIECAVYRKDRKFPQVARAYWRECAKDLITYNGKLSIWAKIPSVMLSKCAQANAHRKAFPQKINGLYIPEEMPDSYDYPDTVAARKLTPKEEFLEAEIVANPDNFEVDGKVQGRKHVNKADQKPAWVKFVIPFGSVKGKTIGEVKDSDIETFEKLIFDWYEPIQLGEKELDESFNDFYLAVEEAREFYRPQRQPIAEEDSDGINEAMEMA